MHISELAERHVEIPEQVVNVGDELLVKVIDIDLERRRISLSLKQANEGALTEDSFDPAQYGMEAQYDDKGNYIYPEGFDPETQEWLPGYDEQREEWEKRYAAARERFEAHKKQLEEAQKADAAGRVRVRRVDLVQLGRHGTTRRRRHARLGRGAGRAAREARRPLIGPPACGPRSAPTRPSRAPLLSPGRSSLRSRGADSSPEAHRAVVTSAAGSRASAHRVADLR